MNGLGPVDVPYTSWSCPGYDSDTFAEQLLALETSSSNGSTPRCRSVAGKPNGRFRPIVVDLCGEFWRGSHISDQFGVDLVATATATRIGM